MVFVDINNFKSVNDRLGHGFAFWKVMGRDLHWWKLFAILLPSAFAFSAVSFWFNRFLGITNEGWHYFYGRQIVFGKVPYRDFFLFVPPLLPLKNALIISLFGDRIIYMHYLAVAELVVLGIVLTVWLSRIFPVFETSIAVTMSLALYGFTFKGESLSGLHQEAVFFPILSGFAASLAIQKRRRGYVLLTGLLAGMSFLAKQTSGVATLICLAGLLCVIAWFRDGWKSAFATILEYGLAALAPASILLFWLARHGALQPFLVEVFLKGSSSKGPLGDIILRPVRVISQDPYFRVEAILAVGCACVLILLIRLGTLHSERMSKSLFSLFYFAAFLSLLLSYTLSRRIEIENLHPFLQILPRDFLIFFGLIACFALFLRQVLILRKRRSTERDLQLLLVTGFGLGLGYLVACSWANYPAAAIPSLVVSLACALSAMASTRPLRALRGLALAFCVLVIFQFCIMRLREPFRWGGWKEPGVWTAQETLSYPQLAGFRVSKNSAEVVNRITEGITRNSNPGDPVLVYPNIPLFYLLSHRTPATFAYVHYIDVAPDYIDRADAENVLRNPPAVIVFWDITPSELLEGEKNWRHGKRSGVHDFAEALNQLKESYKIIDVFQTGTGDRFVVMIRTRMHHSSSLPQ